MTKLPNTCGERLRYIRKIARLSRAQIFDKYGVSASSIKHWENSNQVLSENAINKFMEIYKDQGILFSREWIVSGSGLAPKPLSEIRKSLKTPSEVKEINDNIDELTILKEINFFKDLYPDYTIMIVSNNDMLPFYKTGDYVFGRMLFLDKIKKAINKDCIIQLVNGGKYFRRLVQDDNGNFNITCLNPTNVRYEPVLYNVNIESVAPIIWHRKIYN